MDFSYIDNPLHELGIGENQDIKENAGAVFRKREKKGLVVHSGVVRKGLREEGIHERSPES